MPEYLIPIIERQVNRRYGWRRVTADTLEAAITEAFDHPDDNATDWEEWGGPESTLHKDEDRTARQAEELVHGVRADLVDVHNMLEPWSEQLRISDRLSIGCRVGVDEQRIYYTAKGVYVPLTDTALACMPQEAYWLAYWLSNSIRGGCVTLKNACAIEAALTPEAEEALHFYLTGRY